MKKYILSFILFIFVICISSKSIYAIEYNSSIFPIGYQGSDKETVVFYSKTLKYDDNYYLEGATLEVTDDSHKDYVIVTFRHYVGHSGDNTHSNYMVVPCAFYIDDEPVCQWFISGYDHKEGSQYSTGYRFRNTYRCIYVKEGIKVPRGRTIRLSAYDVGKDDETVAPLIWSRDYIYEYPSYSFNINFKLDNVLSNHCNSYATFDVYIDNKLVYDDITTLNTRLYYNQIYEIKDIKVNKGKQFNKSESYNIKGTIKNDTESLLVFSTKVYDLSIVFDYNQFGRTYNEGARIKSFDLYKNGKLIGKNLNNYIKQNSCYNDTYIIKNIVYRDYCGYKDIDTQASSSYYNGEIHLKHDIDQNCILSINTLLFTNQSKQFSIRFISQDYLITLNKNSIWNTRYSTVLNNSLTNKIPLYKHQLSNTIIQSVQQSDLKNKSHYLKDYIK